MLVDKLQKYLKRTEGKERLKEKITFFSEVMNYSCTLQIFMTVKKVNYLFNSIQFIWSPAK